MEASAYGSVCLGQCGQGGSKSRGQYVPGAVCAWGIECLGQCVPGALSAWGIECLGQCVPGALSAWDSEFLGQCVPVDSVCLGAVSA